MALHWHDESNIRTWACFGMPTLGTENHLRLAFLDVTIDAGGGRHGL
ncbi:hypothetical protein [Mycolicibacterium wolinskyi]|nr:hypothetical protein [Mycolicibacterium wolinskyi]